MTLHERARKAFVAEHGRVPHAVWSAPGRVNLIGDHTDYNDGFALPFALPHRTAVAVAPRQDRELSMASIGSNGSVQRAHVPSVDDVAPGSATGWGAYPAGVAWALRTAGIPVGGVDLLVVGDVPSGAGLSSSHALECAVALALLGTTEHSTDGRSSPGLDEIARWVQRAENKFVGAPTGLLDQTASLFCTEAHALFLDVRRGTTEQIPFDTRQAGLELLVIDTRASHSHSESGYGERRRGCERAAELLGVPALRDISTDDVQSALPRLPEDLRPLVRYIVAENQRVLTTVDRLRAGRLRDIGPLLTESHQSARDDYRMSCPELDLAVDTALSSGALGARMTGGGFGGSAIALVDSDIKEKAERAVLDAFAQRRWSTPRLFTAVPAAGAGRDS